MDKLVTTLTERIDDLENRHRRSNLCIVGLPEGREVEIFLEKWIPEVLRAENFPAPVIIERSHRILRPKHNSPPVPRPLILKFLNYRDKGHVMRAARAKEKIMYGEQHIMFFSNFSVEVTRKRRRYGTVKQRLRARGKQFGRLFPAKLFTLHNGQRRVFESPDDVETFLHEEENNKANKGLYPYFGVIAAVPRTTA